MSAGSRFLLAFLGGLFAVVVVNLNMTHGIPGLWSKVSDLEQRIAVLEARR